MTILFEPTRPGEFLVTEVDLNFRETGSRLAVVNDDSLTWPDEISEQDKAAAIAKLAEAFLIVR